MATTGGVRWPSINRTDGLNNVVWSEMLRTYTPYTDGRDAAVSVCSAERIRKPKKVVRVGDNDATKATVRSVLDIFGGGRGDCRTTSGSPCSNAIVSAVVGLGWDGEGRVQLALSGRLLAPPTLHHLVRGSVRGS